MRILIMHRDYPGQFGWIADALAREHHVVAIGSQTAEPMPGVELLRYRHDAGHRAGVHRFARLHDDDCGRAEQVFYASPT